MWIYLFVKNTNYYTMKGDDLPFKYVASFEDELVSDADHYVDWVKTNLHAPTRAEFRSWEAAVEWMLGYNKFRNNPLVAYLFEGGQWVKLVITRGGIEQRVIDIMTITDVYDFIEALGYIEIPITNTTKLQPDDIVVSHFALEFYKILPGGAKALLLFDKVESKRRGFGKYYRYRKLEVWLSADKADNYEAVYRLQKDTEDT